MRSISVIIFIAEVTNSRSLATGCCFKMSLRQRRSISCSFSSTFDSTAFVFLASSTSCVSSAVTAVGDRLVIQLAHLHEQIFELRDLLFKQFPGHSINQTSR